MGARRRVRRVEQGRATIHARCRRLHPRARNDETRPQDAIDLRVLRPLLTPTDHDEVRRLVSLVMARGFDRDRDLLALADEYLANR